MTAFDDALDDALALALARAVAADVETRDDIRATLDLPELPAGRYQRFVVRSNRVRKRIPFAYWLAFDAVLAPLLVWGLVDVSPLYAVGLVLLGISAFFDVNEAIVKWAIRR